MKKILAILLALVLVLVSAAALAADGDSGMVSESFTFTGEGSFQKSYTTSGTSTTVLPTETLNFVSAPDGDNPDTTNLTIAGYSVSGATGYLTVTVPSYSKVGIYKYTITETAGSSQGATYSTAELGLTVLVTYNYAEKKLDAVAGITKVNGKKEDTFANTYEVGALDVTKTVTGNMGDQSQYFDVTVTFTAAKTVNNAISYTGGSDATGAGTIAAGWTGEKKVQLKIKHGETIAFSDIPSGVTYTVAEDTKHEAEDPTGADGSIGYDISYTGESGTITNSKATAAITNDKDISVDTGITMETVPYIMILALALVGAAMMIIRKKEEY